ncbi:hypothetical protein ID866_13247 [Astraeus odoratus]|nr:hypothetical protein ID866_13247 [Astraeus odoratus]
MTTILQEEMGSIREAIVASSSQPHTKSTHNWKSKECRGKNHRASCTPSDDDSEMDNIPIGGQDEIEEDRQDNDDNNEEEEEEEEANRNNVVDVYAQDPEVHNFRQQLHKHVLFMLKISGTDEIEQAPPPTAREISTFNRQLPGCIEITLQDFRLDLTCSCTSPFNTAAQKRFMDRDYIIFYLWQHMKHLKKIYCKKVTRKKSDSRLMKAACSSRKNRLFKVRMKALMCDDKLRHHQELLHSMKSQGMSSDESKYDEEGR